MSSDDRSIRSPFGGLAARSASMKMLSTLGALIEFFTRVLDVPSKIRTFIARCLKIVCSTRHDISTDPEA
jgi:hypothetical protein